MTSRPQNRAALSTSSSSGSSFLPSTGSGASLPPARYSKSSSSSGMNGPRSTQSVASLLRRFICGCGVFYIAMIWYSGMMALSPSTSTSTTTNLESDAIESKASAQLLQLSPQELVAREGIQALDRVKEHLQQQVEAREQRSEPPATEVRRIRVTEDKPQATAPERLSAPIVLTEEPRTDRALPATTPATTAPIESTPAATAAAVKSTTSKDPETIPPHEYLEEIQRVLDAKRPAPSPSSTAVQDKSAKPLRAMTPKEAFRARLAQGVTLSAREAMALQAIDFAARLAKKREEEEAAAHPTMNPKELAAFQEAEVHALTVKHMPRGETKRRRLKCIGWRATEDCDPDGKRKPAMDRSCVRFVDPTASGYCEVEDRDSGERFRVMTRQCDSLHPQARFRCFESWDFSNFAVLANNVTQTAMVNVTKAQAAKATERVLAAPAPTAPVAEKNGILIVIYPKLIPSAFAIVRTLRSQNCSLPIEFWYRTDELSLDHPTLKAIEKQYGPVAFRAIEDQRATGFATKISAIQHSHFDNLLFLDADNFPVKDPTYLFELPEFKKSGAVFWPDFWHPEHTIFNIHKNSLLWQLVDMDFVDMFEQESGQLLLNKRRNAVALELMQFYTFHRPNHFDKFRLAHGDKDLFRLAWLKTNTSFHFIQHPPGVAGKLQNETFCGMTMVQRDPQGDVVFLHRNAKKLTGRKFHVNTHELLSIGGGTLTSAATKAKKAMDAEDPAVWSHMLLFKPTSRRKDFVIDIFEGAPDFPVGQWCYGKRALATPHFNVFEFAKQPFADLETQIRAHAVEATEMVRALKLQEPKIKQQLSERVI